MIAPELSLDFKSCNNCFLFVFLFVCLVFFSQPKTVNRTLLCMFAVSFELLLHLLFHQLI